jgi:hypothetical protein
MQFSILIHTLFVFDNDKDTSSEDLIEIKNVENFVFDDYN